MFRFTHTKEDAKKLYHRLALHLHPDKGGEPDLMSMLTEAYEEHCKIIILNNLEDDLKKASKSKFEGRYQNVYEDVDAEDDALKIIDEIIEYAEKNERFKLDYTESIIEYLKKNGYITANQYNSLVKAYYSFNMHKKKETSPNPFDI